MMTDEWTDKLSDYLDGGLPEGDRADLELHLTSCVACRRVLLELEAVVARASTLPDRVPEGDLWAGVLEGMLAGDPDVIELGARLVQTRPSGWARRREFSFGQLAAAGFVLMLLSGGTVAMALSGGPADTGELPPAVAVPGAVRTVADDGAPPDLASGLADLEEIIRTQGDRLSPNTLRILEKNLAAIDRAIGESRAALELEPGNPFLEAHLEGSLQRRERFLKDAASLIQATD